MILGMSFETFTTVHVIISLIAIAAGLVVLFGMLGSHRLTAWTALFLLTTILTSVTGFMFPIAGFTPALGTGVVSTIALAVALLALYGRGLGGAWRWIYVISAVTALYVNVLVLITQAFEKLTLFNPAAPVFGPPFAEPQNTQFVIAQSAALVFFIVLGLIAAFRFRPGPRLG